ncbi:MAG: glycosyltransferase, partial [Actinobacteria bacterium]|nr:glycosyltransferase [Actinomycetota bacterium]
MQPESREPESGEVDETAAPVDLNALTIFDEFEVIGLNESEDVASADSVETVSGAAATEDQAWSEWFSDDQAGNSSNLPRRRHHVTTVLVSHEGATWLPAVLTTLSNQTRHADAVVGVDTGSGDDSPNLLRRSLGSDRVIVVDREAGFGSAVQSGLAHVGDIQVAASSEQGELVTWVWLLHDDSAPNASCLEALLSAADDQPSVAILGPKILGWHDQRLLLEAGFSVTGAGRRFTGLERREHDQGQHDGDRDVLAVSSAGMLIRRDLWDRMNGFDPQLPLFRDDLDLCWRAHRAGERVVVATNAVLHHREASAHARRVTDLAPHPHRA